MLTWDSVQQLIRIVMQIIAGALISKGVMTDAIATQLTGAVMSLAGVVWWFIWDKNNKK